MSTQKQNNAEKDLINARIKQLGFRKNYIADKIGLRPDELSHLISGRRRYEKEKTKLFKVLGIQTLQTAEK